MLCAVSDSSGEQIAKAVAERDRCRQLLYLIRNVDRMSSKANSARYATLDLTTLRNVKVGPKAFTASVKNQKKQNM